MQYLKREAFLAYLSAGERLRQSGTDKFAYQKIHKIAELHSVVAIWQDELDKKVSLWLTLQKELVSQLHHHITEENLLVLVALWKNFSSTRLALSI